MLLKIKNHYLSSFSGLPRDAWLLAGIMVVNRSGTMVLFFLMLYLTQDVHLSVSAAGQILSLFGLGAMGGSWLGGWGSDHLGTKRIQVGSLIAGGIGFILLGYVKNVWAIAAMVFMVALIAESFRPASITAMANVCVPEVRTRGLALNRLAVNLGVSVGPALGGVLAGYSYKYIFWTEGLTSLLAAVLVIFLFHEKKTAMVDAKEKHPLAEQPPYKDGLYLRLLLMVFFLGFIFNQLFNTWPLFLKESYHYHEARIGMLMAMNAGMIVLFEMVLVHRLEKKHPILLITMGAVLISLGFGITGFSGSLIFIALSVVLWTTGEMLSFPFLSSFIANRAHQNRRGAYIGLLTFTFSFAFVIGPLLGSWIYQSFGPLVLWKGILLIGLILLSGFLDLWRRVKAESKTENRP